MKALRVVRVGVGTRRVYFVSGSLQSSINIMPSSYSGNNKREYELTKQSFDALDRSSRSLETESDGKMLLPDSRGNIRLGLSWTVHAHIDSLRGRVIHVRPLKAISHQ
jgi:hypothetical protein